MNERKKMGIKYDKTTGLPSNDNTDYNTLLEMWRDEKQKRTKVEDELEKLKAELARAEEDRQYDALVHKRELADLFKGKYEKE